MLEDHIKDDLEFLKDNLENSTHATTFVLCENSNREGTNDQNPNASLKKPSKNLIESNYTMSNSFFTTISNTNNILGPALICLPFIIQKSGVVPTLITLLFISFFSYFSSMCLLETGKLINGIKSNNNRKFDYYNYIDLLIKDSVFLYSSKFCVFLNHLLYCILSIITLSKVFAIFFIEKYSIFKFITVNFDGKEDALLSMQSSNLFSIYNLDKEELISNRKIIVFLIIFLFFIFSFLLHRFIKTFINVCLFIIMTTISFIIFFNIYDLTHSIKMDKRINWFGFDYTYLYGTILFSFSYVSTIPCVFSEKDLNPDTKANSKKSILLFSTNITMMFKFIISLYFGATIYFNSGFSISDYIKHSHENFSIEILKLFLGILLIGLLVNNIVNHSEMMIKYMNYIINWDNSNIINSFVCISGTWILSLLLIVNGQIFLNMLNWSSIFLFGFVNYVLPLIFYLESLNESENFELNYKQSAILDFENFICLKSQEIGLIVQDSEKSLNYFNVIKELNSRISNNNHNNELEIDDMTKERIVDFIYESEGFYSLVSSYINIFGRLINNKNRIMILFYTVILCLMLFMFVSIYLVLYNYFINKTLVVNIFIQIK